MPSIFLSKICCCFDYGDIHIRLKNNETLSTNQISWWDEADDGSSF